VSRSPGRVRYPHPSLAAEVSTLSEDVEAPPAPERVRVRVRKRKQRHRDRRYAWILVPVGGGMLVLVALLAVVLAGELLAVRGSLIAARSSLAEVRAAVGDVDVGQAAASLDRADDELAEARSRSGGPLWTLGAQVPLLGESVAVTRGVVRVASAALDVAQRAVAGGDQLVAAGLDVRVADGQLDLGPLRDAQQLLESLPVERLASTRDELEALEPAWAPSELIAGRRDTLRLADEAIGSIERGRELLEVLPSFLGADGPRTYFLGMQTPAELRGTGGLIGFYGVLQVDGGRFELLASDVYDAFDDGEAGEGADDAGDAGASEPATGRIAQLWGDSSQAAAVDDEYEAHYGHTAAPGHFSNVNVDPDLPTTARIALDLFTLRTGVEVDGMVLADPIGLEALLTAAGGELEVPDLPTAEGVELPATLDPASFARFVTVDVYEQLGDGRSEDRKLLLRWLGDAAFARVFDGAWDGVAMSRALGDSAGQRHLQVFSRDEREQEAFTDVGIAGALRAPEGADLFAVTANNAVGGKQDVHLGHRVAVDVELDDPRREDDAVTVLRRATVRTEVTNPLPSEGLDDYVIGNCLVGGDRSQCFEGPPGENRTWFSLWTDGDTAFLAERGDDGRNRVRTGELRGLSVFDRYLETPSESTLGFELDVTGTAPVRSDAGELVYEWAWWAQSKAIPTLLEVTVAAPEGWSVAEVEVAGGGSGRGFGVHGDGQPLEARIDGDGRAHLSGTVTADTTLRVRFSGAEDD
jgi:hypothetical protein